MTLAPGSRIGPYEILASLGEGGMGQVFRAKDTRLGRTVAVKSMHESFAKDPERIARFEREAQLLASLNHPNIAAIHGVEEAQGSTFLVLEFVDGRPLSDILQAGAPPQGEALAIAKQIAGALAAAHERGIIHRDLKPGNVMVTADGQVKVLDFGLGKAIEGDGSRLREQDPSPTAAQSPTMTMAATQAGIILGTAGYMSPEQAKGRIADKRSDVWAFGCVLYELLTGKRAFDGEDVTEILAAIVRGEPEWTALPATTPPAIRELVRRCLIKNRTERLADMSVVQFLLAERTGAEAAPVVPGAPADRSRSIGLPMVAGLVVMAVLATVGVMKLWPAATATATSGISRLSIPLPGTDEVVSVNMAPVATSPDGALVAYTGLRDGKAMLFVRALSESEPRLLPGTDGARSPFFSPTSQWIGFFAQGRLKKITTGGTALQDLAEARDARGGAWSGDETIYFAPGNVSGIWKVPAAGGTAVEMTQPDRAKGEISHRWPHVLPDNKSILFTIWTGPGPSERHIVQQSIGGGAPQLLVRGGDTPRYVSPGYLVYGRLDELFAVPWRPGQGDVSGVVPMTLSDSPRLENEGSSAYAISTGGTLAYIAGGPARLAARVVWVDRAGKPEGLPLTGREFESVAISPDGLLAAVQIQEAVIGIWLYNFDRQTTSPFMTTGGSSQAPLWSHDGKYIIYRGTRNGERNLFMKASDGTGAEERLTTKPNVVQSPTSVSHDGRWVIFNEGGSAGGSIWSVPLTGDRTPKALVQDGGLNGHISPGGQWLAFQTSQEGQGEVIVQPFPGPGPRLQISGGGGWNPRWSRDGKELFYEALDKLMVVDVRTTPTFSAGAPRVVFEGRYRGTINSNTAYDVSLDGKRFLRIQRVQPERAVTRIEVVLNWFSALTGK